VLDALARDAPGAPDLGGSGSASAALRPGPRLELLVAPEASALVPLLSTPAQVILVDAVVAAAPCDAPPGEVLVLAPEDLEAGAAVPVSTHGLGVAQAIALARIVDPAGVSPRIRLVAVRIAPPAARAEGLSPAVAAAVPRAAASVRELAGEP
jgi:hydrogenase maturation protease